MTLVLSHGGLAKPAAAAFVGEVVDDVKVTILSDMVVSRFTHAEWGFAALVEVTANGMTKKFLFDTGAEPQTVLLNAKRAKISLCDIETVVLSHNHQDHTMGLVALREECMRSNPNALKTAIVGGPEIFWSRPESDGTNDNVFMPRSGVSKTFDLHPRYEEGIAALYTKARGTFLDASRASGPMAVPGFKGVWVTGRIPRFFDEKTYPGTPEIVNPTTGQSAPDLVPEDQAVVINTKRGIVVLMGCAHAGVVNTLTYASRSFAGRPLLASIGGMHTFRMAEGKVTTPGTLSFTAQKLRELGVKNLLGAHCTGLNVVQSLRERLGFDVEHGIAPPTPGLNAPIAAD